MNLATTTSSSPTLGFVIVPFFSIVTFPAGVVDVANTAPASGKEPVTSPSEPTASADAISNPSSPVLVTSPTSSLRVKDLVSSSSISIFKLLNVTRFVELLTLFPDVSLSLPSYKYTW